MCYKNPTETFLYSHQAKKKKPLTLFHTHLLIFRCTKIQQYNIYIILKNNIKCLVCCTAYLKNKKGYKQASNSKEFLFLFAGCMGRCEGGRNTQGVKQAGQKSERQGIYREVMSLSAWSSSSLMALYLSFWAYNSSADQRSTGSASRRQEQQRHKSRNDREVEGKERRGRRRQNTDR